jgi:hypothetical protein
VVTDVACRRWGLRDQTIDFCIQRFEVSGRDDVGQDEIALLDEEPKLVVAEQG